MADKKKQQDPGESKRKQVYDLYRETGLIKTTSFEQFSNADEKQQEQLFELGRQKGLFKTTTVDQFKGAFKKKDQGEASSTESSVTSQTSGSPSDNSVMQPADPTLVNIPADVETERVTRMTSDPDQESVFQYEVPEDKDPKQTNLFTEGLYDANSARDADPDATERIAESEEQDSDTQSPGSQAASQYSANVEDKTNVEAPVEVKSPADLVSINQKGEAKKDTTQAPQTEQIAKQEEFEGTGLPGDELTDITSGGKDKGGDAKQKDTKQKDGDTSIGRGLPGDELTDTTLEPKQESGVGSADVVSTQESDESGQGAPSKEELEEQGRVLQDIFKEYEKIQKELEQTTGPGQYNYSMMQFSSEQIEEAEQKRNQLKQYLENQNDLLKDKVDGISSGVINSENYERYLYTNDDGIQKVDYEKVSAQANQITNQLGINSSSYVNELFENRLTAAARAQRDMPKIQEKTAKKIKEEFGVSKKKLAQQARLPDTKEEALDRTVQDATERMLSYAAARESINKSSEEEFSQVKARVQEQSKAVTETLKQQKQEIEGQVSEIRNRLQRGEISQEQADSMIGELKDGWEEQRESAKNKLAESISEMTEMQARISEKAQANLAKYKKLTLRNQQSPFDPQTQQRLNEITKNAVKEVEAEKRQRAKEIEDSLYNMLPGDGFAPISAVNSVIGTTLELNRSFYESLGGGIEGIGQTLQSQSLENFGTGMKREDATYRNRELGFSDYLNPRNAADMTGSVLGSMLPSFVASAAATGAVTLTGGTTAPAVALAMGAGGAAAWGTETAQIAGRDWQRAIAQGKSQREANRIYNERWQSQALMAPLYATEAVPFLGKSITTSLRASRAGKRVGRGIKRAASAAPESVRNFGLKGAKFGRVGAAAGTEYVTEFGQEFTQQSFGKIIEDDKSFNDLFSVMSAEDAKKVAAEILPVVVLGGGGQAVSEVQMAREEKRAKKRAEDFEKFAKKSVTKDRTSDYAPHLGRQHIFNVTKNDGPKTAMAVVNSLVSSGQLKQEEAKQLITAVSSSERALDEADDAGLSEDAASVYGALRMKRDQTEYEANAAQGEAAKNAKKEELNQIDEKLNELAQTGATDIVTVKHKGGQSHIITPDEARKLVQDEEIQAAMQNGDFQIAVQAKEGGKDVSELTKEISEIKREADLDTKDETVNLTVEEQEVAKNVRADSEVSNMAPQQRPQKIAEKYGISQDKADKIARSVYKRELDVASNQYKVDPERGYTYEVESENELPATLADKRPVGKTEITTRKSSTVTYTFSGQQLIEAGLASEATESADPNEEEGTPVEQQSQGESAVDVPPPEPNQLPAGATPKPLPAASISSYDGEFVTFEGTEGYLDVDESGKVTVESADGKQVFELGDLGDPDAEAQFEKVSLAPTPEQVVQEDGSVQVYNKTFTGDVQANTTTDNDGNILKVQLQDSKGNTRTFRGELAERIVYEDMLRRLQNRPDESVAEVEATLTSNAEIKQKIDNAQSKRKRQIEKRQGKAQRSKRGSKSQGAASSGQSSGRQTSNEWSQEELEQFQREVEQEQLENVEKEIEAFKERNKSYFRKDGKMKGNAPKAVKRDFQDLVDILEYKQILDAEAQAQQAGQRSEAPAPTQTGQGQGQQGQNEGTGTQGQSGEASGAPQPPDGKEPHQMTRSEFIRFYAKRAWYNVTGEIQEWDNMESQTQSDFANDAADLHFAEVEAALREGKTVPDEVLEDYPDITKPGQGGNNTGGTGNTQSQSGGSGQTQAPTTEEQKLNQAESDYGKLKQAKAVIDDLIRKAQRLQELNKKREQEFDTGEQVLTESEREELDALDQELIDAENKYFGDTEIEEGSTDELVAQRLNSTESSLRAEGKSTNFRQSILPETSREIGQTLQDIYYSEIAKFRERAGKDPNDGNLEPPQIEAPAEEQSTDPPPQDPPPQNPPELPGSGTTGTAPESGQQGSAPTQQGGNTGTTGTAGTAGTTGAAGTGGQTSEEFGPEQTSSAYESSTTIGDLVIEEVGRRQEEGNSYQREEEFNKDPRLAALQAKKDELSFLENGEYEAETGEEAPADAIESLRADIELLTQSLEADAQRDDQIAAELEQIQKQDSNGQEEGQQPVLEGLQDGRNQNEERQKGSELRPQRKERKEEQKQVVTDEGDVVVFTQPKKGERAPEYRLVRQPDGTLEVKSRKTGKVSTNRKTRQAVISQYIRSEKIAADGKTSQEAINDGDVTEDDISEEAYYDSLLTILETSTNPAQLASVYHELFYNNYYIDPETQLTPIENAILKTPLSDISEESFARATDRNFITDTMAKAYRFRTRKGTGTQLDDIAMEASDFLEEEEGSRDTVTEEDVAEFIIKYPQGPKQALNQRNPKLDQAYEKFKEVTGLEPNPNIIETILDSYAKLQETEAELRNDANTGTSSTPTQQGTKTPQGSGQSRSTTDTSVSQKKKGESKKQSGQQSKQSSVGKKGKKKGAPAFKENESVEDYAKRVGYENIHMAVNSVFKNLGKSVTKNTITKQDVADASQASESLNQDDTSYSEKGQELSKELQNAGTTKEAKDWFFKQYKKATSELTTTDISGLFEEYKRRFKELKEQEEERIRKQQEEVEQQAKQGPSDVDPNVMQSRQQNRKGRRLINEAVRRLQKAFPNIKVNILTEDEFLNKFREFSGEKPTYENSQGIYGFLNPYDGEVYLNQRVSNEETAFEEFAHIWLRILQEANPVVYKAAIAKAKKTGSYSDLLQVYDEYSYDAVAEEVLTHAMASETDRRFQSEGALKRSVRSIFQALGRLLRKVGLAYDPVANVGRLTIDKLARYASKDLLSSVSVSSISSSELAKIEGSASTSFSLSDDIKGSILKEKDSTFYEKRVRYTAKFYLTAPVDQSSGIRSLAERVKGVSRAAAEQAAQEVDDLKVRIDEHVREQADNKDTYASKLLEDVNSAFRGEIAMEELRERYSRDIYDKAVDLRTQVDKISEELARQRVVAHGDAVGQINEDLAMYLQNNFKAAEQYKQTLKEASEVSQQRKREISLMDEEQLDEEKQRLQYEVAEKQKRLKEKKLERLRGMIANEEHRNSRNQSPRLKKQIEKVYKQIERLRVEDQEEGPQVPTQELDKQIDDARAELERIHDQGLNRPMSPEEQALFDELAQAQELLESARGTAGARSKQEKRVEVQEIANKDKRLSDRIAQHDAQDLGVVEIEYKRTEPQDAKEARQARDAEKEEGEESEPLSEAEKQGKALADINLLHQNGKQTPLYGLNQETIRRLFGSQGKDMVQEIFGGSNEGIKRIGSPRVLQDNALYQRIMDNLGKYTHRSYMLHDYADFAQDITTLKNYIGHEHYMEGFNYIKGKLDTGRIKKVVVQRRGDPNKTDDVKYLVSYYNEYGLRGVHDEKKVISYNQLEELDKMKTENNGPLDSETVDRIQTRLKDNESVVTETADSGKTLTDEQSVIQFDASHGKVEDFIKETLQKTAGNNEALFTGAPVKGMDSNVLKERKDIDEPIRKLMGEYMNPYVNIYKTLVGSHMALSNQRLVNELMENENILVSREKTSQHTEPVDNSLLMGLGKDEEGNSQTIYMRKDAYNALFKPDVDSAAIGFFHALRIGSQFTKLAFTVASPETQARNFWGAGWAMMTSGNANFGDVPQALGIVSQDFGKKRGFAARFAENFGAYMSMPITAIRMLIWGRNNAFGFRSRGNPRNSPYSKKELRGAFNELVKYGLIGEQLEAGLMQDLIQTSPSDYSQNFVSKFKGTANEMFSEGINNFSKVYRYGDEMFKAVAWLNELEVHREAYDGYPGMSDEDIKAIVADKIRDQQPTYSRVPRIISQMSASPIFGSFIQFHAERYRNIKNIYAQAFDEIQNGPEALRKKGLKRMASATATAGLYEGLASVATGAIVGLSGDDDEAVAALSSEWAANAQRLYVSKDTKKPEFIDLSYIDPNGMLGRAINAIAFSRTTKEGIYDTVGELGGPLLSAGIFIGKLIDVFYENEKSTGAKVYPEGATSANKIRLSMEYLVDELRPKFVQSGAELYKLFRGKETSGAQELKLGTTILSLTLGFKTTKIDMGVNPKKAVSQYQFSKVYNEMNSMRTFDNDESKKKGLPMSEEELAERNAAAKRHFEHLVYLHEQMQELGFSKEKIRANMEEGQIPKYLMKDIENKEYPGIDPKTGLFKANRGGSSKFGKPDFGGADFGGNPDFGGRPDF